MSQSSFQIKHLSKQFRIGSMIFGTKLMALDDINIDIAQDEPWIMSIVGESGSGKTTLAKIVLQLLEQSGGDIAIDGVSVRELQKDKKDFYRRVQPIFQNPFTAFSSRRTVDSYLFETAMTLTDHKTRAQAAEYIESVLKRVGLDMEQIVGKYPNQFSGGELQRISIVRALIPMPKLIVADEPVSMVDASLRMNIVNLFKSLKNEFKVNFIYITHDLSTAYYVSDYIATLYRGKLIEFGSSKAVLNQPAHPYTQLLLESIPRVGARWDTSSVLPDMESKEYGLSACKFAKRCKHYQDICGLKEPPYVHLDDQHSVLCYKFCDDHSGGQST